MSRWIWEIRYAVAGALSWAGLAAVVAAFGVTCYLAGPWAAIGAGLAATAVLYWLVGPLVARLQGGPR